MKNFLKPVLIELIWFLSIFSFLYFLFNYFLFANIFDNVYSFNYQDTYFIFNLFLLIFIIGFILYSQITFCRFILSQKNKIFNFTLPICIFLIGLFLAFIRFYLPGYFFFSSEKAMGWTVYPPGISQKEINILPNNDALSLTFFGKIYFILLGILVFELIIFFLLLKRRKNLRLKMFSN